MIYILRQIGFEVLREQGQDSGTLNWEVLTLSRALAVSLRGCTMREGTKLTLTSSSSCCHVPQCRPSSTFCHFLQKPLTCQSLQDLLLSVHTHFTWLCNTGYWWERIKWEALDLKTRPFQTAHWKKVFKKYQKQFEAWNRDFKFLGFWVLFSFSLTLDPNNSSFWNLETLFYSKCLLSPYYLIIYAFLSTCILPQEHQGTSLLSL